MELQVPTSKQIQIKTLESMIVVWRKALSNCKLPINWTDWANLRFEMEFQLCWKLFIIIFVSFMFLNIFEWTTVNVWCVVCFYARSFSCSYITDWILIKINIWWPLKNLFLYISKCTLRTKEEERMKKIGEHSFVNMKIDEEKLLPTILRCIQFMFIDDLMIILASRLGAIKCRTAHDFYEVFSSNKTSNRFRPFSRHTTW